MPKKKQVHNACSDVCWKRKVSVNAAVQLACAEDCITKSISMVSMLCSEDPVIGGSVFAGSVIHACKEPGLVSRNSKA